ncbi:DUF6385 domain-containing protein [Crassaminicella indica]|uniref:DUF6385 domain-containing protein n=1 Tax=Crassaminicella indica TaxID=2855394 RepID=A0ABX8RBA6_9CLOT|nr:DUF6385 domain-containing protein [Crassaminicella indica]QXM06343.1 hypothetical protein KVH43_00725 [Crassaminicella indica]
MPNNIVFNNVASQMKTQIYGTDSGTTRAIAVDANGKLLIGEISTIGTISEVLNVQSVDTVDTVQQVLNVQSVDTVDTVQQVLNVQSVDTVDTVQQVLNVQSVDTVDNISSVDTVDTVTYVAEVKSITDTVNVDKVGNGFAESVYTVSNLAAGATATVLTMDTSEKNMYSFYVKNISDSVTIDAKIQVAPVNLEAYYIDDAASVVGLEAGEKEILITQKYLKYTRLILENNSTVAGSVVAWYQGHN